MDTRELVRQVFDHSLFVTFEEKPAILDFLLKHERRETVINNLVEQVRIAEFKHGIRFGRTKFQLIVSESAKLFALTSLKHAEEKALTSAEYQRRVADIGRIEEFQAEQDDLLAWVKDNRPKVVLSGEAFEGIKKGE